MFYDDREHNKIQSILLMLKQRFEIAQIPYCDQFLAGSQKGEFIAGKFCEIWNILVKNLIVLDRVSGFCNAQHIPINLRILNL